MDALSSLLNAIPGLGLGDLITILLDNALPIGSLIPTGYKNVNIKNCHVENLAATYLDKSNVTKASEKVNLGKLNQVINEFVIPEGKMLETLTVTWKDVIPEIAEIETSSERGGEVNKETLKAELAKAEDERIPGVSVYWQKYQDIILLLFLCFSVILNGWLDIVFVPLEEIDSNQKASIRLVSSFYIILILLYIKFIYSDDNYDSLMMYFITLAVGRFIYFDFTMDDFLSTIHGFWEELPLLILMTSYSGFICWFGFHIGFLLTSNGVIVSTLLAHLFMVCSIFILDKTRILRLVM